MNIRSQLDANDKEIERLRALVKLYREFGFGGHKEVTYTLAILRLGEKNAHLMRLTSQTV